MLYLIVIIGIAVVFPLILRLRQRNASFLEWWATGTVFMALFLVAQFWAKGELTADGLVVVPILAAVLALILTFKHRTLYRIRARARERNGGASRPDV